VIEEYHGTEEEGSLFALCRQASARCWSAAPRTTSAPSEGRPTGTHHRAMGSYYGQPPVFTPEWSRPVERRTSSPRPMTGAAKGSALYRGVPASRADGPQAGSRRSSDTTPTSATRIA